MSDLNGSYEVTAVTSMGEQKMTVTVQVDGTTFTGKTSGSMGSSDITGTVDGNKLAWKQAITVPMALTIECQGTVSDGDFDGTVSTGAFGNFPLKGKKVG
ncbi:MAG: hypothetical protein EOP94_00900 [Zymomonas sp.]|nr:MAG: hypothetical protein EOP94_00900 [Zymomonas sp.]